MHYLFYLLKAIFGHCTTSLFHYFTIKIWLTKMEQITVVFLCFWTCFSHEKLPFPRKLCSLQRSRQRNYRALLCCVSVQLAGMKISVFGAVPIAEMGWRIVVASISALGLMLITLGVSGSKPSVPAFGGDRIEEYVLRCIGSGEMMTLISQQMKMFT